MKNFIAKQIISRRNFLGQSIITMVGVSSLGLPVCIGSSKTEDTLRIIAYNVLKCTGWPGENVKNKSLVPDLIAQELAKYSPDIINFSESPDESVVRRIADQLHMNYVYFPSGGNWPGAILTHYKIVDSANVPVITGIRPKDLFTRHWGKATIQLAKQKSIIVHSVHLYPHDNPVSAEIRKREISEILKSIENETKEDKSIIVMGDLNHTPDFPEYSQWMDAGFADTFKEAGTGDGLTIRADMPSKRIDYIFAHGLIAKQIIGSRALFEGAFRTNPSDPESFALSDHVPQFAEFRVNFIR
jgi:endonuclease/exonuclease/phosphatase family metal-dependent hydrolase